MMQVLARVARRLKRSILSPFRGPAPPTPEEISYETTARLGADSPNSWIRKSASIGGWLFPGEHEFLWELATRSGPEGDILEIGTWMGKSACIFAGAVKESQKPINVICIDTFCMTGTEWQEQYHRRLVATAGTFYDFLDAARKNDFDDVIIPIACFSDRACRIVKGPLKLAFVDGAHDRINCQRDAELCRGLLAKGGVLAIHDSVGPGWPEVEAYVRDVLAHDPGLKLIDQRGTITAFETVGE